MKYNDAFSFFNSADGNYEVRYKCNVLIYSHGEVLWVPPAIYQVSSLPWRVRFRPVHCFSANNLPPYLI